MNISRRLQILILLLGDLILFYLSLYLALTLRYQDFASEKIWAAHQTPFFYVHLLWLFVFYIGGVYDIKNFASYKKILEKILKAMASASILAMLIFYLVPSFQIAPKTNLLLDIAILSLFLVTWRRIFWTFNKKISKIKTVFWGNSEEIKNFVELLKNNPQLGYEPVLIPESNDNSIIKTLTKNNIPLIIISKNILKNEETARMLYETIPLGISVMSFPDFYESLVEKIPLSMVSEEWFLENLHEINKKYLEKIKRIFDLIMAILLGIPTLLLFPFIALLSKIESSDKVLVHQKRVGKNGNIFTLIKFRSMYQASESDGQAKWASPQDQRITKVGKILRKTRIDELPQLWNVLKGEMSFMGPRPERPEFVSQLKKEIPHYAIRHLVKPGLTGWAQIKYPYGGSVKDAEAKLEYDLYYIKNRSLVLDLAIAAKTIATIISSQGR